MTIYEQPKCSCIICKKVYSVKGIHTHYERSHGTKEQKEKYSDGNNGCYESTEYRQQISAARRLQHPTEIFTGTCEECNEEFTYEKLLSNTPRRTCSKSCSVKLSNKERVLNGFVQPDWTDEMRLRQSEISKKLWEDPEYAKTVMSSNTRFTSKNEIKIRDHFIDKFVDDEWTFGGSLKVEDERIVRDLYSNKLKVCVEYDGIWHFKDIHGQLELKQKKDRLLEQWCVENEYSLIRIDEDEFRKITVDDLESIVYSITTPTVMKLGDRY